jgi:Bacterial proteasome activator
MVNAAGPSGGPPVLIPASRLVVALGRLGGPGKAGRVEEPAHLMRLWALLNAEDQEVRGQDLPAPARARLQRLLTAVTTELSRCVSPDLAAELRQLSGSFPEVPAAAELRVEHAALLGWLGGLVIAMLDQLDTAALRQLAPQAHR